MLVLSRKIGECIVIGDDTVLVVQAILGNRVRLAIQAPRQTKVLRGELSFWEHGCLPAVSGVPSAGSTK